MSLDIPRMAATATHTAAEMSPAAIQYANTPGVVTCLTKEAQLVVSSESWVLGL